jgi:hypothetical protein
LIFNPINATPTLGAVLPAFYFIVGSQLDPHLVLMRSALSPMSRVWLFGIAVGDRVAQSIFRAAR